MLSQGSRWVGLLGVLVLALSGPASSPALSEDTLVKQVLRHGVTKVGVSLKAEPEEPPQSKKRKRGRGGGKGGVRGEGLEEEEEGEE